ncbi:hypothetical protein FRC08_001552 [Ceratobasidium sp. 394]|nr:hypothetical protein FRC08_001552 [Ceratobasidium sp. 394]
MDESKHGIQREDSKSSRGTNGKRLSRTSDHFVGGLPVFHTSNQSIWTLANAFFATALCRAWNLIVLSTLWATCITLICEKVRDLSIQPALLTVYGIVVGFVISYRTSSSFERYNEGRKLWSTIILATRTFSRTVWFHVPDSPKSESTEKPDSEQEDPKKADQARARILVEKCTVINLLEAFSVATKHYLRREDGTDYVDLYHLVKFLPVYALPSGLPREARESGESITKVESPTAQRGRQDSDIPHGDGLPLPVTSKESRKATRNTYPARSATRLGATKRRSDTKYVVVNGPRGQIELAPASNPPRWGVWDIWPLSLLVRLLVNQGISIRGKAAARERTKQEPVSHNIPLEISFYLSSYISALQQRKGTIDVPTTNLLFASLNQLVESLSGLERILTNPIPFSYGVHLWTVCALYVILMPFQIWKSFGYVTIPATAIVAFFFFGFLAAGEEIENPFGYDKNDLNLDSFCHDVIHAELAALTSMPPSDPAVWAFFDSNDHVFGQDASSMFPTYWVERGEKAIREELRRGVNTS